MGISRPFRFGVVSAGAASGTSWTELVRRVEASGFQSLVAPDNLSLGLSPFPALAAAAAVTTTLRVGTYVLANDLRHPVQVAKEAVTLAVLSDGRFELGLGVGRPGADRELAMIGRSWDSPATRIDRLAESVPVLRRLLAGETVEVSGGHYEARGAAVTDRPVEVPLLIAGSAPRMLRLAGALADTVALGVAPTATAEHLAASVDTVRAGARGRTVELNLNLMAVDGVLPRYLQNRLDPSVLADSVAAVTGSPRDMADQLRERRARFGVSYVLVGEELMDAFAPVVAELAGE